MSATIGVLGAIGTILAARLLLLLSLGGAFVLAYMAMVRESTPSLLVLIAYAMLIVAPMVWLAFVSGKRPAGS